MDRERYHDRYTTRAWSMANAFRSVLAHLQRPVAYLAFLAGSIAIPAPVVAQATLPDTSVWRSPRYVQMHALLEKTIFKVDVLTLTVGIDSEAGERLRELAHGGAPASGLADSIARVAIYAQDAWATIEFQRGVSLKQFLNGISDNMRRAVRADIISSADYDLISSGLPRWFAFLAERGIQKRDQVLYHIQGNTLRTIYLSADGRILLDQTDIGPERRLSVLGSYFAAGSDFRDGLIESLRSPS